jgi:hypothetical protein
MANAIRAVRQDIADWNNKLKAERQYALGYKAGLEAARKLCESENYEYNQGYSCAKAIADLPIPGETK